MPSLCCFWCPASEFVDRQLSDPCPTCGRAFNTPLMHMPAQIGNYRTTEPISRGFYGAAYRARQESLSRTVVLKVVPIAIYEHFGKDWSEECRTHAQIAEGTPF